MSVLDNESSGNGLWHWLHIIANVFNVMELYSQKKKKEGVKMVNLVFYIFHHYKII